MLPKLQEKIITKVETIYTKSASDKATSEAVKNPNPEHLISNKSSDNQSLKKGKKPNLEEDNKILLRDVKVLKRDFQNLKERVEKLESESRLPKTSTPKRAPLAASVTSSVDDVRQHDPAGHSRQTDDRQDYRKADDIRQHDPAGHSRQTDDRQDYRKADDIRQHDPAGHSRQTDDRQDHMKSDDVRQYDTYTGHRRLTNDYWQHGTDHRIDVESGIPYDDYYPTDYGWENEIDQYNCETDLHETEYMSDHSYSDVSASYGRDHGLGLKTHYVSRSSGGSSDYYRMASLPSPMRSQPDKQLIAKKSPSTSSEVLQSILLLKNDSFLQTIKLRSNSIANFSAKLNCEVFSKEERIKSNVAGTRGKEKLNSSKIAQSEMRPFLCTQLMSGSSMWCGKNA